MGASGKLKLEQYIFAGLLVILALGVVNMLNTLRPAPHPPAMPALAPTGQSQPEPARMTPAEARIVATGERAPVEYTAGQFRDPLVSLLPQPAAESVPGQVAEEEAVKPLAVAPRLKIEGMFWGGPHPQVLIEGRLYQIGDTVDESHIVEISREGVTVISQGTTFVLRPPDMAEESAQGPVMEHGR